MTSEVLDLVIVGAGISGLAAAYELLKVSPKASILILEGKDRVGGRTLTTEIDVGENRKEKFDLGGQWVTPTQVDIMEILNDLGLETYPQYIDGTKVSQVGPGNKIRRYDSDIPSIGSIYGLIEFQLFTWKIEHMCKQVPIEDPYSSPLAEKYDKMTMESFARENLSSQAALDCIEAACRACLGTDIARLSVLFFLAYANSAGGPMNLFMATEGCAQEMRVKGGTQQISQLLAERVGLEKLRLSEPVEEVSQANGLVTVKTKPGNTFTARRVIISAPPNCVARIRFEPPLPLARQTLMENLPMGHLTKFIVTYDKAYWREAGFSGEIVSNGGYSPVSGCSTGPISIVYDATTHNNVPALVGFIAARAGVEWDSKTASERKSAVLKGLKDCLGSWASNPTSYTEKNWSEEPYSGGCPVGFGVPGVMYTFHALRKPHGKIYWAGTETATHWAGYLSGAVQSGRRAAVEVLRDMNLKVPELLERQVLRKPVDKTKPPSPALLRLIPALSIAVGVIAVVAAFGVLLYYAIV